MGAHRQDPVRPRYGRMALALSSVVVTAVSVLGGLGALPSSAGSEVAPDQVRLADADAATAPAPSVGPTSAAPAPSTSSTPSTPSTPAAEPSAEPDLSLPAGSGDGRRVVFSEDRQRVWLVQGATVERTYLVSGSIYDNLEPGTFEVYSRSESAYGIEDSGTMKWFVRFTQGDEGAAIGFHDIPVDEGAKVQTVDELGTPLSHGCIRQRTSDAKAMWRFASLGTTVVVTA
jgi:L,D-transpeptidase catalytic domain